ncbi:Fc receptor-like A [Corvus hawaiiensis]|uniref:Fc receptor-like A n=1 Tax=Corvus hawaiiensis TaxID=134902 RepID=UPI002019035E|nr:Fc receptor-like A [Corvus hawaiiensis]
MGPPCPTDRLVLHVPTQGLLEGDMVTLRCRNKKDTSVTGMQFYHQEKDLREALNGTELSLSPLQLHHSGRYRCNCQMGTNRLESVPVTVTVHELFPVPVLEGSPEPTEGSPLNLSCLSTPSPLRPRAPLLHLFYRHGRLAGGPQGSPQLLLPTLGVSHSGNYSCQVRSERGPCGRAAPGSASRWKHAQNPSFPSSGCRSCWVPVVPAPAPGSHHELSVVATQGQEAPGQGPPGAFRPLARGGGAVHPHCRHWVGRGIPLHYPTPGPPGDLCRAARSPHKAVGTQ